VTTPVGGLPDVLEDGRNALIFDFGNWETLANRISRLIENRTMRKNMADDARDMVYHHFSNQQINEMTESIYSTVLSR
jgi:glycosyltransferase involved in cell wall biosynthesis